MRFAFGVSIPESASNETPSSVEIVGDSLGGKRINRCNDVLVSYRDGSFWLSEMRMVRKASRHGTNGDKNAPLGTNSAIILNDGSVIYSEEWVDDIQAAIRKSQKG